MGMYTALSIGVELNVEQSHPVTELLRYMIGERPDEPKYTPAQYMQINALHSLFITSRWEYMLQSDSYYFNYDTHFRLRWDDNAKAYFLSGVCNLKNYNQEIEHFLDWLNQFVADPEEGFLGWTMYEEDDIPTILYRKDGKILSAQKRGFEVL